MGAKISVDSATLMNKSLEMIEAAYLFDAPETKIDVLVHRQSVIHSMVEYADGSTMAQLGPPDMRAPIAFAFAWPDRMSWPAPRLDLAAVGALTFEAPDTERFPALNLARHALRAGGGAPAAFNAANETAVARFLDRRIGFLDIVAAVAETLERMDAAGDLQARGEQETADGALETALAIDGRARRVATEATDRLAALRV
jgi:1-deoxy-D-xylulose-5-phosphate reductoisomerase